MRDAGEIAEITEELFEPGCVIIATLVISALSLVMWRFSLKSTESKVPSLPERDSGDSDTATTASARRRRDALKWLAALVATTLLLLIFQLAAGLATGALTLIADSAHTAADTISYAFSWFVERAKCSVAQSERAQRVAARFDALSAVFSVVIVLGTSACATADAVRRLRNTSSDSAEKASTQEDLGLIGPALLGFAVLSTAANCGLLALHRRRQFAATAQPAPEQSTLAPTSPILPPTEVPSLSPPQVEDSEDSFLSSPCLPPPPPPATQARPPRRNKGLGRTSVIVSDGVPPPPPPATEARPPRRTKGLGRTSAIVSDAVPPPSSQITEANQISVTVPVTTGGPSPSPSRERAARRKAQIAWLHQAFHPSCNDANCSVSHDSPANSGGLPSDATTTSAGTVEHDAASAADDESNLNLYGAVLHLITDVLRSLVILVVALLVQLGIIRDAPTADAICAIAVSICILLGSIALLRAAAKGLCGQRKPLQMAGELLDNLDELVAV